MNFFEHQDRTRRNTRLLFLLYLGAIAGTILGVYGTVIFLYRFSLLPLTEKPLRGFYAYERWWWEPKILLYVCVGTALFVLMGTLFRIQALSKGGKSIAEILRARKLDPGSGDLQERKLLNITEEMSIASGIPVPDVYLLENEKGINAFAAGFTPSDAIIGVTKGTISVLNREELQGVIAHEFSHILNGDMRINLRLTGLLYGISNIGSTGMWLIRNARGRRSGPFFFLGLGLLFVGYAGVFFASLIQAAVSRQREFLADASAVQFTRNPGGISQALKKIGGYFFGTKLLNRNARDFSHFMFADSIAHRFLGLFATHPPLDERVRRIDPTFSGEFPKIYMEPTPEEAPVQMLSHFFPEIRQTLPLDPQRLVMEVGTVSPHHMDYAEAFLKALPMELVNASHQLAGACAIAYSVLLDPDEKVRGRQIEFLASRLELGICAEFMKIYPRVTEVGAQGRLPLLDLSMPTLRRLSPPQYEVLSKNMMELVTLDEQISLSELVLVRILSRHLATKFRKARKPTVEFRTFSSISQDCEVMLSALSHQGSGDEQAIQSAFSNGMKRLSIRGVLQPKIADTLAIQRALNRLSRASSSLKQEFLEACVETVSNDGKITFEEAELLRAIGDTLDCPIPPLLSRSG